MNAYSKDLRLRVLAAVDRGERREEIMHLFGVSVAANGRWLRRRKDTGEVAPRPSPGRTPSILRSAQEKEALWQQLEASPEATLEEHRQAWERERGVWVSIATMSRAIRRLGWTYKQRRWVPPNVTSKPEPAGARG